MTTVGYYKPEDNGVVITPATYTVSHARVTQDDDGAGWDSERVVDELKPEKFHWGVNGQLSTLVLSHVLGAHSTHDREHPESVSYAEGDRIILTEHLAGESIERFRGYIAQKHLVVQSNPDVEQYKIVAYGPEFLLANKIVSGQWFANAEQDAIAVAGGVADGTPENVEHTDLPVIFNEGGLPNRSAYSSWKLGTRDEQPCRCSVFESPGRIVQTNESWYAARHWIAFFAIESLLSMFDNSRTVISYYDKAFDLVHDGVLPELNVEGKPLNEAIAMVLNAVGCGYYITPAPDSTRQGDAVYSLRVFPLQGSLDGNIRRPFMAPVTGDLSSTSSDNGRKHEVSRLHFVADAHNIKNEVDVIGQMSRHNISLQYGPNAVSDQTLFPLWSTIDATTPLQLQGYWTDDNEHVEPDAFSPAIANLAAKLDRTADGSDEYMHVYRSFGWNEDGSLAAFTTISPEIGNLGNMFKVRRPRPIGRTIIWADGSQKATYIPAKVQLGVSLNGTVNESAWIDVRAHIWKDRAGFTISATSDEGFAAWRPYATNQALDDNLFDTLCEYTYLTLLNNTIKGSTTEYCLELRVVGTIEGDMAAGATAERSQYSSLPFTAKRVIRTPRFRYWAAIDDPWSVGASRFDLKDETDDAATFAENSRTSSVYSVGHGSMTLRYVTWDYTPGTVIPGTSGRNIDFALDAAGLDDDGNARPQRFPIVAGVNIEFAEDTNRTELLLDTPLLEMFI